MMKYPERHLEVKVITFPKVWLTNMTLIQCFYTAQQQ